jgi:hypothetical protein
LQKKEKNTTNISKIKFDRKTNPRMMKIIYKKNENKKMIPNKINSN